MKLSVLSLAFLVGLAPCLHAESLGAAAKREEERRKQVEEAGQGADHVISQDELAANKGRTATDGAPAPAVPADSPSAKDGASSEKTVKGARKDAAQWASRAASLEAAIEAAEQDLEAAKSAPLSTSVRRTFVTDAGGHAREVQDFGDSYTEAKREHEKKVAAAQRKLDAARQRLEALEDEARRQGVPPGWLRGQQ